MEMGTDSGYSTESGQAISLRVMTMADIDAVLEIEVSVQPGPWGRSAFVDCISNSCDCLIADYCGEIAGLGIVMSSGYQAEILKLGVASLFQGQGIGRCLLGGLLDNCRYRGIGEVFLEVREQNIPAIGLYRKFGFHEVGNRRAYYRNRSGERESARIFKLDTNKNSDPKDQ